MFCPNCGKTLPNDSRFCENCGAATAPASSPAPAPAPAAHMPPQPQYRAPAGDYMTRPLSVGSYIGMFLLTAIPLAGFILLLVWAFSGGENINRKNYARAVLLLNLIVLGLVVLLFLVNASAFLYLFKNFGSFY